MNKNTKYIIGAVIVIAVVAVGYSISGTKEPAETEPIKIGVILPLSDKAANLGEDMKNAIDLALEEVNKEEVKIELFYEDEKCDPKEAISAYQASNLKGIQLIIGAACSASTLSIAPLAEQQGVVLLTPASAANKISQSGDFIFRNHVTMGQKTGKLSNFAVKNFDSVAIIYDSSNDAFILGNEIITNVFNGRGKDILTSEGFGKDATDFRTQLTKIKSVNPEAIYIGALMPQAAIIVKQMQELGVSAQIIAEDGFITDTKFIEAVGDSVEGIIFSTTVFEKDINPEFWNLYAERFYKDPNIFAAQAYDSLKIFAKIIEEKCTNGNPMCVKKALYKTQDYVGVSGLTSFDENGDALKPIILKTVKNGEFVKYEE